MIGLRSSLQYFTAKKPGYQLYPSRSTGHRTRLASTSVALSSHIHSVLYGPRVEGRLRIAPSTLSKLATYYTLICPLK